MRNMTEQLGTQHTSSLKLIENVHISTFRSPLCSCLLNEYTMCNGNESALSNLPWDVIKCGMMLISSSQCSLRRTLMCFITSITKQIGCLFLSPRLQSHQWYRNQPASKKLPKQMIE